MWSGCSERYWRGEGFRWTGLYLVDMAAGSDPDTTTASQTLTLAFRLEAIQRCADPAAVFADAREWSRHVGIVADDPDAVTRLVDRHGLQQDYELGALEVYSILSKLKWEANTDRYVLIGTDDADRALADYVGWEYLSIQEAATHADWTLADTDGFLARVRLHLPWLSLAWLTIISVG